MSLTSVLLTVLVIDSDYKTLDTEMLRKIENTNNFVTVDGALLPSPTREKLEPVIPRQKEEDLPKSPQKASPKSSPKSGNNEQLLKQ